MASRLTLQKQCIQIEIKKMKSFFDAEELYQKVIKKDPKIGIATVYRFLKKSVQEGKLHSYSCNRKTIYTIDIRNHCHFICESCGKIKHIHVKKLDFMKNVLDEKVCHFQLDITGVCKDCSTK